MSSLQVVAALRENNLRVANRAFARLMQAKLALALTEARRKTLKEAHRTLSKLESDNAKFAEHFIDWNTKEDALHVDRRSGESFEPAVECRQCEESIDLDFSLEEIKKFLNDHKKCQWRDSHDVMEGKDEPCSNPKCGHPKIHHEGMVGECSFCTCPEYNYVTEALHEDGKCPKCRSTYSKMWMQHNKKGSCPRCGVKLIKEDKPLQEEKEFPSKCPDCKGSGWDTKADKDCEFCAGTGKVAKEFGLKEAKDASAKTRQMQARLALKQNHPAKKKKPLKEDRTGADGTGYDDDYVNNPFHGILRKYGYEYKKTTSDNGKTTHTYQQGPEHWVQVWDGNNWATRFDRGNHPNANRTGADLERHLRTVAQKYGLSEERGIAFQCLECGKKLKREVDECPKCGGSDIDVLAESASPVVSKCQEVVDTLNDILEKAQATYHRQEAKKPMFAWADGKSEDEVFATLQNMQHRLIVKEKQKYINIDRVDMWNGKINATGSGCMMVDKTTGDIYGIKGYGVVHKGYHYGTVDNPKIKDMALRASVLERGVIARDF